MASATIVSHAGPDSIAEDANHPPDEEANAGTESEHEMPELSLWMTLALLSVVTVVSFVIFIPPKPEQNLPVIYLSHPSWWLSHPIGL
jgi:hypothetical protein